MKPMFRTSIDLFELDLHLILDAERYCPLSLCPAEVMRQNVLPIVHAHLLHNIAIVVGLCTSCTACCTKCC